METRATPEQYYLLGYGFANFEKDEKGLKMTKRGRHNQTLKDISYWLYNQSRVHNGSIIIEDPELVKFISTSGTMTQKKYVPSMGNALKPAFAAGYLEGYGDLNIKGDYVRMSVQCPNREVSLFLAEQWKCEPTEWINLTGYKALDVFGMMAAYKPAFIHSEKVDAFWKTLNQSGHDLLGKSFYYHKLSPKAVEPYKVRVTDSGYDLHVVEMTKLYNTYFGAEVWKAKTELAVKPVLGYAFDIAGRSSLPDKGWQLLQGIGICDQSYIGGIQATLMKLSDAPLPEFPWRCLQLVPRKSPIHLPFNERRELGDSDRGHGGFGSTDR